MSLNHLSKTASSPVKLKVSAILNIILENGGFLPDISIETVPQAIYRLKKFRATISNKDPRLSIIDSVLVPLMSLVYHNPAVAGPYDVNQRVFNAERNDGLSDLNENLLFTEVSDLLGIAYLSEFVGVFDLERGHEGHGFTGTVYGPFSRPMVSIPVRIGSGKSFNVHFLVDTCGPRSEIPINVFETLCPSATHIPALFEGIVAGRKIQLGICSPTGNHFDIPLLGQDFFKLLKATLIVNYDDNVTKILVRTVRK